MDLLIVYIVFLWKGVKLSCLKLFGLLIVLVMGISFTNAGDLSGTNGIRSLEIEIYSKPHWDCWTCADYAYDRLSAQNGYITLIAQGMSDTGVSNHRDMYIYMGEDNSWHRFSSNRANWKNTDIYGQGFSAYGYNWWNPNAQLSVIKTNKPVNIPDPNLRG
jgi:hypothetical protein